MAMEHAKEQQKLMDENRNEGGNRMAESRDRLVIDSRDAHPDRHHGSERKPVVEGRKGGKERLVGSGKEKLVGSGKEKLVGSGREKLVGSDKGKRRSSTAGKKSKRRRT